MPSWHLANADELAAQYKYTFFKPSMETIAKITTGENVKLIFRFESEDLQAPKAERMWVLIDEIGANNHFRGRLDNDPSHIKDLKAGDSIEFQASHIIDTNHEEPDNIVERYIKRCLVTNRVLHDGLPAGFLYREEPEHDDDSGWRITANEESDEYMAVPDNRAYVSLGAVLNQDDSFVDLLLSPEGSAFIRDPATGKFFPCDN